MIGKYFFIPPRQISELPHRWQQETIGGTAFKQYYFVLQSRREKSSWPQTDIGPVLLLKYCDRFLRIGWIGRMDSAFENAPQCQGHKEFLLEPEHPLCVCVCQNCDAVVADSLSLNRIKHDKNSRHSISSF